MPNADYDLPVKRYPPHWRSMRQVLLREADVEAAAMAEAEAEANKKSASSSTPKAIWPGVSDLRGTANPRNLATWASTIYSGDDGDEDEEGGSLHAIDLVATGTDRATARHLFLNPSPRPLSSYACLVCGSRGGEVTLPALWLLGCRLPVVVVNGGCSREGARWLWPRGVPVVLLTGGRDQICNEFCGVEGGDAAYIERLWHGVPPENHATTAILHCPLMGHRPEREMLSHVLPALCDYASANVDAARRPTAASLGGKVPCTLVTAEAPAGEVLIPAW